MRTYRYVWLYGWGAPALLVIGLGVLLRNGGVILLAWAIVVALTWLVTMIIAAMRDPMNMRGSGRHALGVGVVVATALVATGLLGAVSVPTAGLFLALVTASSPPLVARLTRSHHSPDEKRDVAPMPVEGGSGTSAPEMEMLSDRELCQAWRTSFASLVDARGPEQRGAVVRLREQLLIELDRRYPEAVLVWLATTPRAADGPERFLRQGHPGGHDAA